MKKTLVTVSKQNISLYSDALEAVSMIQYEPMKKGRAPRQWHDHGLRGFSFARRIKNGLQGVKRNSNSRYVLPYIPPRPARHPQLQ
jgi:hypothetical protein